MELLAVERPSSSAPDVARARAALEDALRLNCIPGRLSNCAQRLAEARVAAAPYPEVRARLSEAGAALARAAERARAACSAFVGASSESLEDLDDARDLLASGALGGAAAALDASRRRSRRVGAAARSVAEELEAAAASVAAAEARAHQLRNDQQAAASGAEMRAHAARGALSEARARRAMADDNVREAAVLYEDAARRERAARTRANVAQAAQLAAVVGAAAGARSPKLAMMGAAGVGALCKAAEQGVLRVREEKAVFLSQKMKARERQLDVSKSIECLTAQLRMAGEEAVLDRGAVVALGDVVQGLREAAAAFLDAESFWGRVTTYTQTADGAPVDELVRRAVAVDDPESGAQLCNSHRFRRRLAHAYAHWVALHDMCRQCLHGMDEARGVLYRCMAAPDGAGAANMLEAAESVVTVADSD